MAESDLIDTRGLRRAGEALVYATLYRMVADGLIVGEWSIRDGRRRRRYRLTETGRRLLQHDARAANLDAVHPNECPGGVRVREQSRRREHRLGNDDRQGPTSYLHPGEPQGRGLSDA